MNKQSDSQYHWFSLEPHIHIAQKGDSLLLYNPYNGKTLQYKRQSHQGVFELVHKLQTSSNLLVVPISSQDLEEPVISKFVEDTRRYFMSEWIDARYSKGKPVQMMPIVSIKKGVDNLKEYSDRSLGEGVMKYVSSLSLYINDICSFGCDICGQGHTQFPWCTVRENNGGELSAPMIQKIMGELSGAPLRQIHLLGGNIFSYSQLPELLNLIDSSTAKKIFYAHYLSVLSPGNTDLLKWIAGSSSVLRLGVNFPLDEARLKSALEILEKEGVLYRPAFVLAGEDDFEQAERVASDLGLDNLEYRPFYNGTNLDFFRENVFFTREEVLEGRPDQKEIFTNQSLNAIHFGGLIVYSNGDIHGGSSAPPLGNIAKGSLYEAVLKEMKQAQSWLQIRGNLPHCKSCTFQALCPPVNDYCQAIGKFDLCLQESVGQDSSL